MKAVFEDVAAVLVGQALDGPALDRSVSVAVPGPPHYGAVRGERRQSKRRYVVLVAPIGKSYAQRSIRVWGGSYDQECHTAWWGSADGLSRVKLGYWARGGTRLNCIE